MIERKSEKQWGGGGGTPIVHPMTADFISETTQDRVKQNFKIPKEKKFVTLKFHVQ